MATTADPRGKYNEEELDMLTEEERAGLLESVDDEEEDTEGEVGDADADQAPAEPNNDETQGEESEDPAAAEPAAAEAPAPGDPVDENETAAPASALPAWQPPADYQNKLADIERQKEVLDAKFDDGEITAREYRAQVKPLDTEERQINEQLLKASIARETSENTWMSASVPEFLDKHSQYEPGSKLFEMLDYEVRRLQFQAEGAGKNKFDPTILQQAHQTLENAARKALGLPPVGEGKKPEMKPNGGKKRELPPSLAFVPAADSTETDDGGDFAYLDRLADKDGVAFEDALRKMSDADRERYLAGS